jgi:alkylation response protein AidB-like acyl-CoA dehydrogenase
MYRTAGLIDEHITASQAPRSEALRAALEELAIEASIAKVAGSETLDYVLDENVQIHGGNGYVTDYPAERYYRDARVNRIFEGTNEINRLLIPGMLIKRALKGELAIIPAARRLMDEIVSPSPVTLDAGDDGPLTAEGRAVEAFKRVTLLGLGAALERYGQALQDEQEVLLWLADLAIETYAADSAFGRAGAAVAARDRDHDLHVAVARIFISDAALRLDVTARQLLAAMADGDTLRMHLAALRRFLKVVPANTVVLRRRLADEAVSRGGYPFRSS